MAAVTPISFDNVSAIYRLWALGAVTTALTLLTPFAFYAGGDNYYMAMTIPAGLVALAATPIAKAAPTKQAMLAIITIAILLRGFLLVTEPLLSTDIYRYVWDGKVQAAGINPYRYVPADAMLDALRDSRIFPNINRADYAVTIYPPVAQIFFFAVTRLGENVTVMRLGMLGCEAMTAAVIILLLLRMARPVTHVVTYAWHPLPMWEIANNGHVDALMIALMMLGLWLAFTARPQRGAIAVAFAALAKPFALVALPAVWRPWDWKIPALVVATFGLCYLPYASVGLGVLGFLASGYLNEEGFASGDHVWPLVAWRAIAGTMRHDVGIYFTGVTAILGAMALVSAFRADRSIETSLANIKSILLTALLLISPNYPWYFLIIVPFLALGAGAPAWAATIGALLLQEEAGWGEFIPLLVRKSALYGAVLLACVHPIWQMIKQARGYRGKAQ